MNHLEAGYNLIQSVELFTCQSVHVFSYPSWSVSCNLPSRLEQTYVFHHLSSWFEQTFVCENKLACRCLEMPWILSDGILNTCMRYHAVIMYDFRSSTMVMIAGYHNLLGSVLNMTCWAPVNRLSLPFSCFLVVVCKTLACGKLAFPCPTFYSQSMCHSKSDLILHPYKSSMVIASHCQAGYFSISSTKMWVSLPSPWLLWESSSQVEHNFCKAIWLMVERQACYMMEFNVFHGLLEFTCCKTWSTVTYKGTMSYK